MFNPQMARLTVSSPWNRAFAALAALLLANCSSSSSKRTTADFYRGPPAELNGTFAMAPQDAPPAVHRAVQAGNSVQNARYQYGGGHGKPSWGLDCSGTVSYVLRSSGLIKGAACSQEFRKFGNSGPGKWISIYAKDGHAFMTIAGLRLDTGGSRGRGESGPRWRPAPRNVSGFKVRHPPGL